MWINREKRIKYLGFDDIWFTILGIFIISWVTDYLFSNSLANYPLGEAILSWSVSLFFTIFNWLFMRSVLIYLRIKYPAFKDIGKRVIRLFVILILSVLAIDVLGNILFSYMYGFNFHPLSRSRILLPIVLISIMVQAIYEAIYHYVRLKKSVREEEQAKQMIVQAQLDALRNQAQPHFLFNTLNTLRDIIDQNTKEEAKEFVNKISDVYRFILESGNADLIPIKDELRFARAYIHIQSERFGDNLKLNWDIPTSKYDKMIIPMSLQLLLENAIKHNVISRSKPLSIEVKIEGDYLVVENAIQLKSSKIPSTKVGLKNIERRYNLISDKAPIVESEGAIFKVSLPLLQSSKLSTTNEYIDH